MNAAQQSIAAVRAWSTGKGPRPADSDVFDLLDAYDGVQGSGTCESSEGRSTVDRVTIVAVRDAVKIEGWCEHTDADGQGCAADFSMMVMVNLLPTDRSHLARMLRAAAASIEVQP